MDTDPDYYPGLAALDNVPAPPIELVERIAKLLRNSPMALVEMVAKQCGRAPNQVTDEEQHHD